MSNSEVWKVLALSLASSAECVLANAHRDNVEVYGAGDLKLMIEAIKQQKQADSKRKQSDKYHKDARSVLHLLNETCGRGFRETDTNLTIISQRLKEPEVTFDGVGLMIARQCQKWMNTTMADYLRPATLFGKEKFDAYYAAREQPVILADDPKAAAARQAKMDFLKAMLK